MGKFKLEKKLDLSFVGPEWAECYILFKELTMTELQELTQLDRPDIKDKQALKAEYNRTIKFLQDHFIEGCGIDNAGNKVAMTKDDISQISARIVGRAMDFLAQG